MKNTGQILSTDNAPHVYGSNRIELHETKEQGNVSTSIKNIESVASVEREIFELLRNYKGETATFYYWFNGQCYIANYTLKGLSNIFLNQLN